MPEMLRLVCTSHILYKMNNKKKQRSSTEQAQFVIDNFREWSNREIAEEFGWLQPDPDKGIIKVKNFKRSIERKFNISLNKRDDLSIVKQEEIKIPETLRKREGQPHQDQRTKIFSGSPGDKSEHSPKADKTSPASQAGERRELRHGVPKEGFDRHTMIIRDEYYTKLKRTQKETGKLIREIMDEILSKYLK